LETNIELTRVLLESNREKQSAAGASRDHSIANAGGWLFLKGGITAHDMGFRFVSSARASADAAKDIIEG